MSRDVQIRNIESLAYSQTMAPNLHHGTGGPRKYAPPALALFTCCEPIRGSKNRCLLHVPWSTLSVGAPRNPSPPHRVGPREDAMSCAATKGFCTSMANPHGSKRTSSSETRGIFLQVFSQKRRFSSFFFTCHKLDGRFLGGPRSGS